MSQLTPQVVSAVSKWNVFKYDECCTISSRFFYIQTLLPAVFKTISKCCWMEVFKCTVYHYTTKNSKSRYGRFL